MVLPISTTHDQPAHPMLELNLLEFAEWLLADGSNFSLFQETSHYMPIISLLLSIIIHYISLFSHQIPMIFPSYILRYSSNILQIFLTYPELSSDILKYPQIFFKYPQISSDIFKYIQIFLKYP